VVLALLWSAAHLKAGSPALPLPYGQSGWPAQHHDAHNSDWLALTFREFLPAPELRTVRWVLRETNNPTVEMVQASVSQVGTQEVLYVTTGKLNGANFHAYSMDDGHELWHSAPATNAVSPGPNSVALTSGPTLDASGDMFLADSRYLFCYSSGTNLDARGNRPCKWQVVLPHLQVWNPLLGVWQASTNVANSTAFAKPFLSLVFSRPVNGQYYVGGISIAGDVFFFNPANGAVVAEAHLQSTPPGTDPPCNPYVLAQQDDPMSYSNGSSLPGTDTHLPFGIWCVGTDTDAPDLDYFMNPCQIELYLAANTAGTGTMVANMPAVIPDPQRANVSRIYVTAAQSAQSALLDADTNVVDGMVYRVDFDPTLPYAERLKVMNYQLAGNQPVFNGRMPNGQNSATSPNVSPNQRWIFCADRSGLLYCFDADTGTAVWTRQIGTVMGSPTTWQAVDAAGRFKLFSFGGFQMHAFEVDAATGSIATNAATGAEYHRALDFSDYLLTRCWRTEPAYQQTFRTADGVPFERVAAGACYMIGSSNRLFAVYTMGWHHPLDPTGTWIIPTHSAVLVVNPDTVWTANTEAGMVEASYLDTNGTCEVTFCPSPSGRNRAVMFYGSQSACFAQFLDANNQMPEAMKPLYVRPYGGMRIVELPLTDAANLPPTLALSSPADGSYFVRGATVNLRTSCADPDGQIGAFNVYSNGVLVLAKSFSGDWERSWLLASNGTYTVTAEVYDNNGARTAATSTFQVGDDSDGDGLPDVQEMALGTSVSAPDTDGDGFNDGVELWAGTSPKLVTDHPRLPAPTFVPEAGTYFHNLLVALTNSAPDTRIRYTTRASLDGALPTADSPLFAWTNPIVITHHASCTNDPNPSDSSESLTPVSLTVLAQAFDASGAVSTVVTGRYVLNKVQPTFGIVVREAPPAEGTKHQLDVYHPRGMTNNRVLVFVYGGAWMAGDKDMYLELGNTFAGYYGFTTVVVNYRLSDPADTSTNHVVHPDHINDVADAFAWTYHNISRYGGDSNRIYLFGQSAGAHLASLLALDCSYLTDRGVPCDAVKGVVSMSGAYELNDFVKDIDNPLGLSDEDIAFFKILCLNAFGSLSYTNLANASPARHLRTQQPPFHVIHAWADMAGFIQECLDFRDLLTASHLPVTFLRLDETNIPPRVAAMDFPFGGHFHEIYAVNTRDWDSLSTRTVVDFLDNLDPPPAVPWLLSAAVQAETLELRWPIRREALFLESAVTSDGGWQPVFEALTPTNGCYELRQPLSGTSRFYRLRSY
jgi:acetyl esterase/lipase/outer membrane protein assembly factor BamB